MTEPDWLISPAWVQHFNDTYKELADQGTTDGIGGHEYHRVLAQTIMENWHHQPHPITGDTLRTFIDASANRGLIDNAQARDQWRTEVEFRRMTETNEGE